MAEFFYNEPGVVTLEYDQGLNVLVARWEEYKNEHVQPCLNAHIPVAKQKKPRAVIVDASTTKGSLSPENQQWFAEDFFPRLKETGVKAVITVQSENVMANLSSSTYSVMGQMHGIDMVNAASFEDAVAALESTEHDTDSLF